MNKIANLRNIGLTALALALAACGDDKDYTSHPPLFSDMTFNGDILYAGDTLIATAVQSRTAQLVDRTTYSWELTQDGETVDVDHHYIDQVVYPYAPQNPTDTLVIETPGVYTLTLKADYNISGQSDGSTFSTNITNGTVTCSASLFRFMMTITKRFRVNAKTTTN